MYCPKCGKEVGDNAKFCSKCGASLLPAGSERKIFSVDKEALHNTTEKALDKAGKTINKAGNTLNKAYSHAAQKTSNALREAKDKTDLAVSDYKRNRELNEQRREEQRKEEEQRREERRREEEQRREERYKEEEQRREEWRKEENNRRENEYARSYNNAPSGAYYPDDQSKTVSLFEWVIVLILMAIPIVNFIVGIVWILSENLTKRNYAIAALILFVIKLVIFIFGVYSGYSWLTSTPVYELIEFLSNEGY